MRAAKTIRANNFGGFMYEVFDQFGHTSVISRSYSTRAAAEKDLLRDIQNEHCPEEGRRTAILWPSTVTVKGKKYLGPKKAALKLAGKEGE